jgi:hypothetical protein
MNIILIILFVIWVIGTVIISNKHSKETISSIFGFKPAQTTFKGWVYLVLWAIFMFFIIGTVGLLAGY